MLGSEHTQDAERFLRIADPRESPQYSFGEASRYIGLPESTMRAWFIGTTYGSKPYLRRFSPFLKPASHDLVSFFDVASAHVLLALKRKGVTSEDLRSIVQSLREEFPDSKYLLLGHDFFMFGKEVVLKQLGQRLSLSKRRQLGFKAVMDRFLSRLELDENDMPVRFSPLHSLNARGRGLIMIDPNVSCGRPVIKRRGIMTSIVWDRYRLGESARTIAKDLRLKPSEVKEAINYSKPPDKAAA